MEKFLKKNKKMWIAFSCVLMFLAGMVAFLMNYEFPLTYNAYAMSAEFVPCKVVESIENGRISWWPEKSGIPADTVSTGKRLDVLYLVNRGMNNLRGDTAAKIVKRDNEEVRVVYCCYSKTLWDSIVNNADFKNYNEAGSMSGSDLYGDAYEESDYEPHQRLEIYYLKKNNVYKLEELPDAEYDSMREKADLIWSGIV